MCGLSMQCPWLGHDKDIQLYPQDVINSYCPLKHNIIVCDWDDHNTVFTIPSSNINLPDGSSRHGRFLPSQWGIHHCVRQPCKLQLYHWTWTSVTIVCTSKRKINLQLQPLGVVLKLSKLFSYILPIGHVVVRYAWINDVWVRSIIYPGETITGPNSTRTMTRPSQNYFGSIFPT